MLAANSQAPLKVTTQDETGKSGAFEEFLGEGKTVVYFYPKDDTPGCTKEACGIRDEWSQFKARGIKVLGVSPDSEASHQKFIQKYDLPFSLLSDPEHKLADAFGAWGEKQMYGRKYMGIFRSTFVIDQQGTVVKVYPKVKPAEHAKELLEDIEA